MNRYYTFLRWRVKYVPFALEDYVNNPIALARIKTKLIQGTLAARLSVSQAYISTLEGQTRVTPKTLQRILAVIEAEHEFVV